MFWLLLFKSLEIPHPSEAHIWLPLFLGDKPVAADAGVQQAEELMEKQGFSICGMSIHTAYPIAKWQGGCFLWALGVAIGYWRPIFEG